MVTMKDPQAWKQYLRLRSQLLAQRYGVYASEGSIRSISLSMRSNSQLTLEGDNGEGGPKRVIVPTADADASRALVGNTSLGENYSFSGVHHIFDQHTDAITHIRWAQDERCRVGIASLDGTLSICTVSEHPNKSAFTVVLRGHTGGITDFGWSISNDLIVTCSADCTVRVWDPNSGECIRIVEDNSCVLCCVFQPLNNNLVVTGNSRGQIQVLNISTGMYLKTGANRTSGAAMSMCCDNFGKLLWVGDDKGNILSFLMDINSGKLIKGRRICVCEGSVVTSLCARAWVSREARDPVLLVNATANCLLVYKVATCDGSLRERREYPIRQNKWHIRSNFCPLMSFRQGACVMSGSEDCCVYLVDIEREPGRHSFVNKLQGHSDPVLDVCFNHDESFLASGDAKGTVIIWKRERK